MNLRVKINAKFNTIKLWGDVTIGLSSQACLLYPIIFKTANWIQFLFKWNWETGASEFCTEINLPVTRGIPKHDRIKAPGSEQHPKIFAYQGFYISSFILCNKKKMEIIFWIREVCGKNHFVKFLKPFLKRAFSLFC